MPYKAIHAFAGKLRRTPIIGTLETIDDTLAVCGRTQDDCLTDRTNLKKRARKVVLNKTSIASLYPNDSKFVTGVTHVHVALVIRNSILNNELIAQCETKLLHSVPYNVVYVLSFQLSMRNSKTSGDTLPTCKICKL